MAEYSETNYYEVQIDDIAAGGGYGDLQDYMNDMATLANTSLGNAERAEAAAENAEASKDYLEDLKNGIEPAVDAWLEAHPEATTTVQDESLAYNKMIKGTFGFVMPEMFGAVGDGTTNDYNAFSLCAEFAKRNNLCIVVPRKRYYLNGGASISLFSDVICLGSTFIVGDSHFKTDNPLFEYVHDVEGDTVSGIMSNFIVSNAKVNTNYSNKYFVLDTKIAYGTAVSPTAEQNETIKEVIYTRGDDATVYFTDDVSPYLSDSVEITNISDMNERGYCFSGAIIKQKTENSFGICFMRVRRNNMTIKDVQIAANNTQGQGSVFICEYCNNLTFDNIKSFSSQPQLWTYEIGIYYSANVLVNNFKGFNNWSSIATRGLKNYTLKDSVTTTFDCHWNAYGTFLCDGCHLYDSAHIGYGRGDFIVKDIECTHIGNRSDYVQPWEGRIVIENAKTKDGLLFSIPDDNASGYSSFFNTLRLPTINIVNLEASERSIYMRIPDSVVGRLGEKPFITLDSIQRLSVAVPYTNIAYKAILKGCPFTAGSRSALEKACNIVYDDNVGITSEYSTATNFTNVNWNFAKVGGIVTMSFTGILANNINSWTTMLSIPQGYRPSSTIYATASLGTSVVPVLIGSNGNVQPTVSLTSGDRLILAVAYIRTSGY